MSLFAYFDNLLNPGKNPLLSADKSIEMPVKTRLKLEALMNAVKDHPDIDEVYAGLNRYISSREAEKFSISPKEVWSLRDKIPSIWKSAFTRKNFPKGNTCSECKCSYPGELYPVKMFAGYGNPLQPGGICPLCQQNGDTLRCGDCGSVILRHTDKYRNGGEYGMIYMLPELTTPRTGGVRTLLEALGINTDSKLYRQGIWFSSGFRYYNTVFIKSEKVLSVHPKLGKTLQNHFSDNEYKYILDHWGQSICYDCLKKAGIPIQKFMSIIEIIGLEGNQEWRDSGIKFEQAPKNTREAGNNTVFDKKKFTDIVNLMSKNLGDVERNSNIPSETQYGSIPVTKRKTFGKIPLERYIWEDDRTTKIVTQAKYSFRPLYYRFIKELFGKYFGITKRITKNDAVEKAALEINDTDNPLNKYIGLIINIPVHNADEAGIRELVTRHFDNHKFTCKWTLSDVFVYGPNDYVKNFYGSNLSLNDQISLGVWSCRVTSKVEDLDIDIGDTYISISFLFAVLVDVMEGNPENVPFV